MEDRVATLTNYFIWSMIPSLCLQTFNECFKSYLSPNHQKNSKAFILYNFIIIAVSSIMAWLLMDICDLYILGFGIVKFIVEFSLMV